MNSRRAKQLVIKTAAKRGLVAPPELAKAMKAAPPQIAPLLADVRELSMQLMRRLQANEDLDAIRYAIPAIKQRWLDIVARNPDFARQPDARTVSKLLTMYQVWGRMTPARYLMTLHSRLGRLMRSAS